MNGSTKQYSTLTIEEQAKCRALAEELGVVAAAKRLGLSVSTFGRLAGGLRTQRLTVAATRANLASLAPMTANT